jgi:dynein heavy chain
MLGTSFVSFIKSEVESWEKKLFLISEIIDEWLACQRNWQYLESIFSTSEIKIQLPLESKKFESVDLFWCETMNKANHNPLVINNCNSD